MNNTLEFFLMTGQSLGENDEFNLLLFLFPKNKDSMVFCQLLVLVTACPPITAKAPHLFLIKIYNQQCPLPFKTDFLHPQTKHRPGQSSFLLSLSHNGAGGWINSGVNGSAGVPGTISASHFSSWRIWALIINGQFHLLKCWSMQFSCV